MVLMIIGALLIFGLLVFVHEWGHFTAAKAVGIKVNEFSLGMGPVLLKTRKGETQYSLKAFPIGGSVRMEGDEEDSADTRSYNNKPKWAKALVLVAGSAMNYLLAVVLFFVLIMIVGQQMPVNTVAEVQPGYPAAEAGLQPGDTITAIDGKSVGSWQDVLDLVGAGTGETIDFTVQREDSTGTLQEVRLSSKVAQEEDTGRRIVGILPKTEPMSQNIIYGLKMSFVLTFDIMKQMLEYIGKLFVGQGNVNDLVGPVGITKTVGDSVKLGWEYVVNLTAVISLNLAIVNMLPIPALDGGRLLFLLIEAVIGRRISEEVEGRIHFAGFVLLMALMIFITVKDVNVFILK